MVSGYVMLGWSGYLSLVISLVFAKLNKREKAQVCGAPKAPRVLLHHVYMCVLILGQGLHLVSELWHAAR